MNGHGFRKSLEQLHDNDVLKFVLKLGGFSGIKVSPEQLSDVLRSTKTMIGNFGWDNLSIRFYPVYMVSSQIEIDKDTKIKKEVVEGIISWIREDNGSSGENGNEENNLDEINEKLDGIPRVLHDIVVVETITPFYDLHSDVIKTSGQKLTVIVDDIKFTTNIIERFVKSAITYRREDVAKRQAKVDNKWAEFGIAYKFLEDKGYLKAE